MVVCGVADEGQPADLPRVEQQMGVVPKHAGENVHPELLEKFPDTLPRESLNPGILHPEVFKDNREEKCDAPGRDFPVGPAPVLVHHGEQRNEGENGEQFHLPREKEEGEQDEHAAEEPALRYRSRVEIWKQRHEEGGDEESDERLHLALPVQGVAREVLEGFRRE